jgi:exosome complex RNA-binding protein Rrp42 (RNase PH superfamily)
MASLTERLYIQQGAELNMRIDGRGKLDFRPFSITTGLLSYLLLTELFISPDIANAMGSARICLDETELIVVIKVSFYYQECCSISVPSPAFLPLSLVCPIAGRGRSNFGC